MRLTSGQKSLAAKILALGCNPFDFTRESRAKVQSGMFLQKCLRVVESKGEFDNQSQAGYFFKWAEGPYSPSLQDAHEQLVNRLSENSYNQIHPPHWKTHSLRVCHALHVGPNRELTKKGTWARGLATIAYLRVGGSWTNAGARDELREALGQEITEYYEEMRITLHNLGLKT